MREIILDTETTGLDERLDRIIELGAVELVNKFPTGRTFHEYINPGNRQIHHEAAAVHGIRDADLVGKPTFADIAPAFLEFIDGAHIVAHNAGFDVAFINAELARIGADPVVPELVVDTLALARRKHPMGPNSLDALCKRYGVDNTHRTLHGALLDSELLAEVYIELAGGRQAALGLEVSVSHEHGTESIAVSVTVGPRPTPLQPRLSEAERDAHRNLIAKLGETAIWRLTEAA
ncbi:MAG: DNA polymerase III subunit epsilon [Rhizobiaceae bacterium]|nr:DNA polymerase III subunit epsilon [Rhizobiaceae bacterium]